MTTQKKPSARTTKKNTQRDKVLKNKVVKKPSSMPTEEVLKKPSSMTTVAWQETTQDKVLKKPSSAEERSGIFKKKWATTYIERKEGEPFVWDLRDAEWNRRKGELEETWAWSALPV